MHRDTLADMLIDHTQFKNLILNKGDIVFDILTCIRKNLHPFELDKEYFYTFGLSRSYKIRYIDLVGIGTLTQAVIEPR